MNGKLPALLLCMLIVQGPVFADSFLELESSALGDGWFQYRLKTFDDSFFTHDDVLKIMIDPFTNRLDYGATLDWTNPAPQITDQAAWQYALLSPSQVRPYERVFLAHSGQTNICHTNKLAISVSFTETAAFGTNWTQAAGQTFIGFVKIPCLMPCPSEAADDNPSTNLLYTLKLVPDIQMQDLVVSNGVPFGFSYNWDYDSTVLLQGTTDFTNWTNIAYVYGTSGNTLWSTNQPLDGYGSWFRVNLISSQHITNLPPLNP
jgi:hypothetical protein